MSLLFGIEWESSAFTSDKGVIFKYTHKDFGEVFITEFAIDDDITGLDPKFFPIILSVLRENNLQGKTILIYHENKEAYFNFRNGKIKLFNISEIVDDFPKSISEKLNRTLTNLAKIQPAYGQLLRDIELYDCYSKDYFEVQFILNILQEKDLIESGFSVTTNGRPFMKNGILLKEKAWIEIEANEKLHLYNQVFIAMWFDIQMNDAFIHIENSCKRNGYNAFRIDNKEHNNEISGEILYEIRNSKFLIADVTGQRQGVYFEAGYAMALGLNVIWCCQADEISKVHFDTRQYNHVVWNDPSDLEEKLYARIKGTIL